jgi:hypothetical protein
MILWDQVPAGHRERRYQYSLRAVRSLCQCGFKSTWARTVHDALSLWIVHIRSLARPS